MSQQNPTIPTATQAKGIDAAVNDLQTALSFDLSWLTNGMGRAYRRNKTRSNGASAFLPMVYLGTNFANDFFNATPDNDKEGQSIILVGDATHTDYQVGFYGWLQYPISIIFSANLNTIDSALLATEDFTEHLMEDVRDSIRGLLGKSYRVSIETETREFEDVYSEFDISVGNTSKPLLPMTYFRFECTLTVKEDCGNNTLNRCQAILQNLEFTDYCSCIIPVFDFSTSAAYYECLSSQQISDIIDRATYAYTEFDGINEYINFGNDSSLNFDTSDPFTINLWVRQDSIPLSNDTIYSRMDIGPERGYFLIQDTNGTLFFQMTSGGVTNRLVVNTAISIIPLGYLSLITLSYNGSGNASGVTMSINNINIPLAVFQDDLTTFGTTESFLLGRGVQGDFVGYQSNLSIFNRVLTVSEKTSVFNKGVENPDYSDIPDLISHMKLSKLNPIDEQGVNNGTSFGMDTDNIIIKII